MDPGSANTGRGTLRLLEALDVQPIIHRPEQPQTKGQVESAQNLVERQFELMQSPGAATRLHLRHRLTNVLRIHCSSPRVHSFGARVLAPGAAPCRSPIVRCASAWP